MNEKFFNSIMSSIYDIVVHCKDNVEYYRKKWDFVIPDIENFTYSFFSNNIPYITKEEVALHTKEFVADGCDISSFSREETSGTSGTPFSCYKSKKGRIALSKVLWDMRRCVVDNINILDKFAHFYAFRYVDGELTSGKIITNGNILEVPLINLNEGQLLKNWQELCRFQPRWIQGPPTALYNLAQIKEKYDLPDIKGLELIELSGEFVPEGVFAKIKDNFKCAVTNHYGCREFWAVAFSCDEGHLHISNKSVFVETIPSKIEGKKELLITGLLEKGWPLIRYHIGDFATIKEVECDSLFESKFVLDIEHGRVSTYCDLVGGMRINSLMFAVIIKKIPNPINNDVPCVSQYQAVKLADNHLLVKMRLDNEKIDKDFVLKNAEYEFRKIINSDVLIDYVFVERFDTGSNGKHREFIDNTK